MYVNSLLTICHTVGGIIIEFQMGSCQERENMKKKIICILLALCLLLCALSACAKTDNAAVDDDADISAPEDTEEQDTAADKSMDYSKYLDDNGYFKDIVAADIVTLPEYKGVLIPESVIAVDESAIQTQLDSIAGTYAEYEQIIDRAVEDGDTLNIDYVGSVDGVEFGGGSTGGTGTDVTIGVTSYIEGFLEQLVGHTPGENFDIDVTFPDPYENNPDLAGKAAVFNITINYIQGDKIDTELTDSMVGEYTSGELNTVDEMRNYLRESFLSEQKRTWYQNLISSAQCEEIPESVMEFVKESTIDYYRSYAEMYAMELEDFLAATVGVSTVEEFVEMSRDGFETTARCYLAVQAIAEKESLSVTDEDLENAGYLELIDTFGREYLCQVALQEIVVPEFIYENSKAA